MDVCKELILLDNDVFKDDWLESLDCNEDIKLDKLSNCVCKSEAILDKNSIFCEFKEFPV